MTIALVCLCLFVYALNLCMSKNSCLLYHASLSVLAITFLKKPHFLIFVTCCVRVCVCVCVHVGTEGPFLLMEYSSLLFLFCSQILTTAIQQPPPKSYNHHLHCHMQLPPP